MIEPAVEIKGTLLPNGTVQLDAIPSMAPGRVVVTLRNDDWWAYLQQFRHANETRPETLKSSEEIRVEMEQVRNEFR